MKNEKYKQRLIDKKVKEYLEIFGAVLITGPKWCGKTWTARNQAKSEFLVADPKNDFNNRKMAELETDIVLVGDYPRLIDEWQEVPKIWDAVRYKCDEDDEKGKFILTGSSTPVMEGFYHSGAGRIGTIKMRPMSLYELGISSGKVSLKDLCDGKVKNQMLQETNIKDLINFVLRGGWPRIIKFKHKTSYRSFKRIYK